ncbi:LytTR family DNA-binding domain-containing protein [Pleionea sp. CnH1-48]|uniref:LytR/AlgR family response regulator transcription factor n=1 Tax=Pleionea sp. CnH1-48 TaxID=2954494 RepID=UPI0020979B94|nr:LytTR family DNA-binding domain-containing protein [Pleionea sp. CnH1-48]MCO7226694.1 LytTR family DNA-binding domain-containing protein [Pleionea sp. CnH1-48]
MIKAVIVDDESLARRGLQLRLKQFDDIEVIAECCNGKEALQAVAEHQPQLMFLDIQMPGMDGFDVVKSMQGDNMPLVIFVTAFDQYAIEAFEVHAVDYVLKPVEEERLEQALVRARDYLQKEDAISDKKRLMDLITHITGQHPTDLNTDLKADSPAKAYPEKIAIKDRGEISFVKTQDIEWVEAAGDYMCIHANGEVHVLRSTLKQLEGQLNPTHFQRIHRSTIVNMDCVEKVCSHINSEYFLVLKGGARLKMSRSYKDKIKHFL